MFEIEIGEKIKIRVIRGKKTKPLNIIQGFVSSYVVYWNKD